MKGFTKFIMIFSSIIFAIGIVLCIVGAVMGGKIKSFPFNGETENISKEFENVKRIEIDLKYGAIDIKEGEKFKIEGKMPKYVNFVAEENDEKLKISDDTLFWNSFLGFGNSEKGKVTVYIPKDTILEKCDIDIDACNAEIEELKSKRFNLSAGAGKCIISKLEADECKLDIGAGSLEVLADIEDKIKIDCGVGKAKVELIGSKYDFDYSVESGVGEVNIAGEKYNGIGANGKHDNNSDKKIDIDCGVGSVKVDFKEE